jgi:hypothetical protein
VADRFDRAQDSTALRLGLAIEQRGRVDHGRELVRRITHPSTLRAQQAIADATEAVEASRREREEREERMRDNPLAETKEWQTPEPEPTPVAAPRPSREVRDERNTLAWNHFVEGKIQEDWDTIRGDVVAQFVAEYVADRLQALITRVEAVELVNIALQTEVDVLRNKAADSGVIAFKRTSTDVA